MRKTRLLPLLVVAALLAVLAQQRAGPVDPLVRLTVERLRTEYAENPLGIDVTRPRLGWILQSDQRDQHQTAYQVQAATSRERLESGTPDLWDSGRVQAADSAQVRYRGRLLPSFTQAFWRVRIWDTAGRPSQWSTPAWWETAIMRPADWRASWIGARIGAHGPDPLLRKEVVLPAEVTRARAYIVGLGNYELYLNGRRVGTRVLDPAFTDYRRRVQYSTYDVTSMLKAGRNAVGIALGRGRYALTTPNTWRFHQAPWRGDPRALLRLSIWFADGTQDSITTDGSWTTRSGPTRFDSVYAGETYDARSARAGWDRPGYHAHGWTPAVTLPAPGGRLQAQAVEPMQVVETFTPASITTPKPRLHIVDMGRTVAGWVRLRARGRAGTRVTLRYGERLHPDGTVNNDQPSIDAPIQTDTYIVAGRGEEVWEPRFSYKGFRYVELKGLPAAPSLSDIEGRVVRSSLASIGDLRTSDPLLNRIHRATRVSLAGNLHGIPTDTPTYEKNGWLGDMDLVAEATMLNFDAARFLTKWIADIRDAQAPSGLVPVLAPTAGYGYGDAQEWGSESVILPWLMYQWYGDRRVLTDSYRTMKAYVDFETRRWPSGIAKSFIGDWNAPGHARPPERSEITATAYYYLAATLLAKTAKVIGRPAEAAKYARLRDRIRRAFIERFFDPRTNIFATSIPAGYRQTSNAIALTFGLVPPDRRDAVAAQLAADVRGPSRGHINTGMFGTKELLPALSDSGYGAEALAITQKTTYPSWGYWLAHGADSLWEHWELTARSHNHFMFGTVDGWFFTTLAGLRPSRPGFETFTVRPGLLGNLTQVQASTDTVRGRIAVHWRRGVGGRLQLDLTVPGNSTATLHLPARSVSAITEGGNAIAATAGVRVLKVSDGTTVLSVGSGSYRFNVA